MNLPKINLVVIQPSGYVHSLVFLDTARYFRYQLRRAGFVVDIRKNRLQADAVNVVFGAHLGFPAEWQRGYSLVFVNLEQLADGGAALPADYARLLQRFPVVDYFEGNRAVTRPRGLVGDAPWHALVEFAHAPFLAPLHPIALEDRPLDLLFIGSMNDKRRALISRIEACGVDVAVFDRPIYGPERDEFIRSAKGLLNIPFYSTGAFEQVRAFGALSLGTPVVSLRNAQVPKRYEDTVQWFDESAVEPYFQTHFASQAWRKEAQLSLQHWVSMDGADHFKDVIDCCIHAWRETASAGDRGRDALVQPRRMNLGSGKDYLPGWLNVDILERAEPDVVMDLAQPINWPIRVETRDGRAVHLDQGCLDLIYANNVLEHVGDLPTLMGNALQLLRSDGRFVIEVPYERAVTAWQDPTHIRAMNENSWLYYTEWFWYLGWFDHRFDLVQLQWLDAQLKPCQKEQAAFMRVELRKVETSPHERVMARVRQADFGGLPDDDLPAPVANDLGVEIDAR